MTITHTAPPPPSGPVPWPKPFAQEMLVDMLRIRHLEEKAAELYGAGKIRGFLHLCIGEVERFHVLHLFDLCVNHRFKRRRVEPDSDRKSVV